MIRRMAMLRIVLFVNIIFSSGNFSDLDIFSIYGSTSFNSYKESFVSESLELVNVRPNLKSFTLGFVYNANYEISFSHLNNSETINIYNFPYSDNYILTKFYFHINRFEKFKFKVGLSSINSQSNEYLRNSILFGINKEINYFNNPVVLYLNIEPSYQDYILCNNTSFTKLTIGGDVKLFVDKIDNNELKDIIWLGFALNTTDYNKYYLGFNTGLFFPLK
jgi:hypothetical protein